MTERRQVSKRAEDMRHNNASLYSDIKDIRREKFNRRQALRRSKDNEKIYYLFPEGQFEC